jgi:uncharacterized protein
VLYDTLVPALPFQPLCRNDCPGLCSECGARLADDRSHTHETADPRWAELAALQGELQGLLTEHDGRDAHLVPDPEEN